MDESSDDEQRSASGTPVSGRCHNQADGSSKVCRISDDMATKCSYHLLYIGKLDLPHHPVRMRYLPPSNQRYLLYGEHGYQEMATYQTDGIYALQEIYWETLICDCVQTSDKSLYVIARCHKSAVLACFDEFMFAQNMVEVRYPIGCLSSLATNLNGDCIYGTNQELNCVLRFTDNLDLSKAERFGVLWRPFDCCTSQGFNRQDGSGEMQFLFVSNLDAGICVFNMDTMEIVAECGDDLSPGAKYLAYDPKRSLLFVSSSGDRLLRCYKFQHETPPEPMSPQPAPSLHKVGDFLVTNHHAGALAPFCGPQCIMWDPDLEQLAVIGWSRSRGKFSVRLFHVNI